MLTPLVDVMFLLLLFFMFTSPTTPFGLLRIAGGSTHNAATPTPGDGRQLLVTVVPGGARLNGQPLEKGALADAIRGAMAQGYSTALVNASVAATAQDLVDVVDALRREHFPNVVVIEPGGGT